MASLRIRLPGILPAAAWRSPTVRLVCSVPPLWWRRGRPRTTHRSYAEVELLSRLAELLMPQEPIGELFRDFPVKKSQVWGSPWLRPDLTAFGVLKHAHAALFIEYDGFFRHSAVQGQAMDERKTIALLGHAPPNSYVLRIGHVTRDLSRAENAAHAVVNVWRAEHEPSLMKVVQQTGRALLCSFEHVLEREVCERLSRLVIAEAKHDFLIASSFARQAVLTRNVETKKVNMCEFLEQELRLSTARVEVLACKFPRIWGVNIDRGLRPIVAWLEDLGLSRKKVAKVFARFPQVLGCSIEGNLKPTVTWLEDVGLNRQQVAKVVAGFPQVLGCSIEDNLKPTVAWLEDVGLSRQQVAKVVAGFPHVLGYSIDGNLKPKVAWLEYLGLSELQVAKVVARFPQLFGCSIDGNLKPKVAWLEDVGLNPQQVAKVVTGFPQLLGYSVQANLKPKVAWLEDVGLSHGQIAKVVACFPTLLSCSIPSNLSRKHILLERYFSKGQICSMIEYLPPLLGFSHARLSHRLNILEEHERLSELAKCMVLTDAKFAQRFPPGVGVSNCLPIRPMVTKIDAGSKPPRSEYFMVAPADVTHDSFFKLSKQVRRPAVRQISEACQGVITTLQRFAAQNLEPFLFRGWWGTKAVIAECERGKSFCVVEVLESPAEPAAERQWASLQGTRIFDAKLSVRAMAGILWIFCSNLHLSPDKSSLLLGVGHRVIRFLFQKFAEFFVPLIDKLNGSLTVGGIGQDVELDEISFRSVGRAHGIVWLRYLAAVRRGAALVWIERLPYRISSVGQGGEGPISLQEKREEEHVEKIFRLARVRYAVMTNIPYVEEEAQHWRQDPPKPVTKGDWMSISQALKKEGLAYAGFGASELLEKAIAGFVVAPVCEDSRCTDRGATFELGSQRGAVLRLRPCREPEPVAASVEEGIRVDAPATPSLEVDVTPPPPQLPRPFAEPAEAAPGPRRSQRIRDAAEQMVIWVMQASELTDVRERAMRARASEPERTEMQTRQSRFDDEESDGEDAQELPDLQLTTMEWQAMWSKLPRCSTRAARSLGSDEDPEVSAWRDDLAGRWADQRAIRGLKFQSQALVDLRYRESKQALGTVFVLSFRGVQGRCRLAGFPVFDTAGKVNLPLLLGAHKQLLAQGSSSSEARQVGWLARQALALELIDDSQRPARSDGVGTARLFVEDVWKGQAALVATLVSMFMRLKRGRLVVLGKGPARKKAKLTTLVPLQEIKWPQKKKAKKAARAPRTKPDGALFSEDEDSEDSELQRAIDQEEMLQKLRDSLRESVKLLGFFSSKEAALAPRLSFDLYAPAALMNGVT
ncbi:mTERF domain-containing protein 1, mitochondrial [Symbiodinium microadriaticum]|uniref:mTERF domain-containing protein 1, mitochondrial n=1 Tax=Symbiodinium microadriaticum TaxID=2951 RepID=A0A1Q9ESS8_SYMMI|nr:mTERF domain-containing protein 1, mitochondrial [Symbiodinium microadriaticum]